LIVLVYALAVARVTRLITADKITERPRERLQLALWAHSITPGEAAAWAALWEVDAPLGQVTRQMVAQRTADSAEPPLSVYLLGCPWCASIYVGAAAAPLAYFWGTSPWLLIPALTLAFSYFTGFAAGKE
jgi:hypothetical protein